MGLSPLVSGSSKPGCLLLPKNTSCPCFHNLEFTGILRHHLKAAAELIAGIGLLKLAKWARTYYVALTVIFFASGIVFHLFYSAGYTIPYLIQTGKFPSLIFLLSLQLLGLVWVIFVVKFFSRSGIKEQFE